MMRSNNRSFDSRGKLVVVEGIDGSGKSTQIRVLEKWLKPHLVFYLDVDPNELVYRVFQINSSLDKHSADRSFIEIRCFTK